MCNKTSTRQWKITLTFLSLAMLFNSCPSRSARAEELTNEQKKKKRVEEWQHIFGPIDFNREEPVDVFNTMIFAWPQLVESMREFDDRQLSPSITAYNEKWMKRFIKEAFRPDVTKIKPAHYYLGLGPQKDILEYRWRSGDVSFRTLETQGVMLLMPEPQSSGLEPQKGVAGKELAVFLWKVLDLPYNSVDELNKSFNLPTTLHVGDFFTNSKTNFLTVGKHWENYIVGFVGTNGINVICFKIEHNPDSPQMGFSFEPHWLEGHLFESDGKTPVKREEDKRENQK